MYLLISNIREYFSFKGDRKDSRTLFFECDAKSKYLIA